jgi:presenilin-like A22 family membrane protease
VALAVQAEQNPIDFTILAAVSGTIVGAAALGFLAYRRANKKP